VSASPITVGRSATVTGLVTDIGGNPLAGETVTFTGIGTFAAASGTTDASGVYSTTYTAPAAPGTYTLTAAVAGLQDDVSVDVSAATLTGGLWPLQITGGRSTTVVATVLDLGGQPMAGMPITFTAGAGTVATPSGTTGANGELRTVFTPPATPGTYRVQIWGPNGIAASADVTVVPPSASLKFRGNSTSLTSATKAELRRLAQYAASINATVIVLEGHTAALYEPGTPRLRARLSARRAAVARSYLRGQLRRYRNNAAITVMWYGADVPIADNATSDGRSLNRRVDVYMR
jgi:outer membrane protein OmpA-like peptidoglycan-associated protein